MSSDKLPAVTPLTVLEADDPKSRTIGFVVREYLGGEVFKLREGLTEAKTFGDIDTDRTLKNRDDLKVGDTIFVPSLWGDLMKAEVKQHGDGSLYGDGGRLIILLNFAQDDRQCWTTAGYVNLKAVEKLRLYKDA